MTLFGSIAVEYEMSLRIVLGSTKKLWLSREVICVLTFGRQIRPMPKRELSLTVKVSELEQAVIRQAAVDMDMDVSELLRACVAIALPTLQSVPFLRRIRLDDSRPFARNQ